MHRKPTRSCAQNAILGGCLQLAQATGLPLEICEIGSSAGLNLGFDRYGYDLGVGRWGASDAPLRILSRWEGHPPPLDAPLRIASRAGCDMNPLDPGSPRDRERLLSYVWPDQAERLARMEAALDTAARFDWRVEQADAAAWVDARFGSPGPRGRVKVLLHTIVWQYLSSETKLSIEARMDAAGSSASPEAPVAWLRVEPDGVAGSAGVHLTLWP